MTIKKVRRSADYILQAHRAAVLGTLYCERLLAAGFVFDEPDSFHAPKGIDPVLAEKIWYDLILEQDMKND